MLNIWGFKIKNCKNDPRMLKMNAWKFAWDAHPTENFDILSVKFSVFKNFTTATVLNPNSFGTY